MTDRIQLKELRAAIEKASRKVLNQSLPGQEPLIVGFVDPNLSVAEAEALAKEVAAFSGLNGTPTVIEAAATGVEHARKAAAAIKPPIIIGLRLNPKA